MLNVKNIVMSHSKILSSDKACHRSFCGRHMCKNVTFIDLIRVCLRSKIPLTQFKHHLL